MKTTKKMSDRTRHAARIDFLICALLVICLSGCDRIVSIMSDDEDTRRINEDVPIGVVVALTGKHAEPYGFPMQRGFELAREEINNLGDVNLTFITVDDKSSADGAKEAVRYLVARHYPYRNNSFSKQHSFFAQ